MIRRIVPLPTVRMAPVTPVAVRLVETLPQGGTVLVDAQGRPVVVVPFVPLQITRSPFPV